MSEDVKGVLMGRVIEIDEARIKDHLGEMVRGTVEEALNAMLDAEADRLRGAARYERSEARRDTWAGSYDRALQTKAGEVTLKVPKLRRQTPAFAASDLRDGDHRALPPAREFGGRGSDRDVPGRRVGAPGRGHHRGAVGNAGVAEHSVQPEQVDLRQDRSLAASPDRGRASVLVPGRHRHEADLGRRGAQRLAAGGQRGERRGLPGGPGDL